MRTSRPRRPTLERRRIQLVMSVEEYNIILAAAEEADRSLNNYAIRAILNQARTELQPTKEVA